MSLKGALYDRTKTPRGQLKNGNPAADPSIGLALMALAPKCAATSKRTGKRCGAPAMRGRRVCYHHGGKSTGPKTQEGKRRAARANLRHGQYTKEAIAERTRVAGNLRQATECLKIFRELEAVRDEHPSG